MWFIGCEETMSLVNIQTRWILWLLKKIEKEVGFNNAICFKPKIFVMIYNYRYFSEWLSDINTLIRCKWWRHVQESLTKCHKQLFTDLSEVHSYHERYLSVYITLHWCIDWRAPQIMLVSLAVHYCMFHAPNHRNSLANVFRLPFEVLSTHSCFSYRPICATLASRLPIFNPF